MITDLLAKIPIIGGFISNIFYVACVIGFIWFILSQLREIIEAGVEKGFTNNFKHKSLTDGVMNSAESKLEDIKSLLEDLNKNMEFGGNPIGLYAKMEDLEKELSDIKSELSGIKGTLDSIESNTDT